MKRKYESEEQRGVDINMSPLIDCVFLLLIFFIVTSVLINESAIEVERPHAATATAIAPDSILISLTADGRIVHGDSDIPLNGLRGLISRLIKNGNRPVILVADRNSRSGQLIEMIDECKLAGAKQVSVAATPETSP